MHHDLSIPQLTFYGPQGVFHLTCVGFGRVGDADQAAEIEELRSSVLQSEEEAARLRGEVSKRDLLLNDFEARMGQAMAGVEGDSMGVRARLTSSQRELGEKEDELDDVKAKLRLTQRRLQEAEGLLEEALSARGPAGGGAGGASRLRETMATSLGGSIEWGTPVRASKLELGTARYDQEGEGEGEGRDATVRWQPLVTSLFDDKAAAGQSNHPASPIRSSRNSRGEAESASPAVQVAAMRSRAEKLRGKRGNTRASGNKWEGF